MNPRHTLRRHLLAAEVQPGDSTMLTTADLATTIWDSRSNYLHPRSGAMIEGSTAPGGAVKFRRLIWVVYSSHASAANGVSFEGSINGTDWDVLDQYTLAATTATTYNYLVRTRHVRVVFTNSNATITAFRSELIADPDDADKGS
jgi:hypothetical protein